MDKESILRLGLEFIKNIDLESSDELYDPNANNHIIKLKLNKEEHMYCPYCGLINSFKPRGSKTQIIKYSSAIEDNITIKLTRRVFLCECGHTFKEPNPFSDSKRKMLQYWVIEKQRHRKKGADFYQYTVFLKEPLKFSYILVIE